MPPPQSDKENTPASEQNFLNQILCGCSKNCVYDNYRGNHIRSKHIMTRILRSFVSPFETMKNTCFYLFLYSSFFLDVSGLNIDHKLNDLIEWL